MKRNLLILGLVIVFLTGCAGISLKDNTTQVAVDISAATIGYLIGQSNQEKIPEWNQWLETILMFDAGDSVLSYEEVLAKGLISVSHEPFLKMQIEKLIKLLEFPELQPPSLPFLKAEYLEMVKIVLSGFRDGLYAAQAEKD